MHKTGDLHPFGLAVSADSLRSLQKVLDLREVGLDGVVSAMNAHMKWSKQRDAHIGVRVVDERVKLLDRFPDTLGTGHKSDVTPRASAGSTRRSVHAPIRACTVFLNSARTRTLKSKVCFSTRHKAQKSKCERARRQRPIPRRARERTVLLAIEVLDTVARLFVLAERGLVFGRVELGRLVPSGDLPLELVHCGARSARLDATAHRHVP